MGHLIESYFFFFCSNACLYFLFSFYCRRFDFFDDIRICIGVPVCFKRLRRRIQKRLKLYSLWGAQCLSNFDIRKKNEGRFKEEKRNSVEYRVAVYEHSNLMFE